MGDRRFPKSSADPTSYLESVQPLTMTIVSELVLVDDGEAVLLDAEDLVHFDAGEPVLLGADLVFGLVCVNVEACKIVELFRELRADPTSYSESLKMTIFSDPSIPELVLLDAGEPVLLVTLL